jgi:hypothetical protein
MLLVSMRGITLVDGRGPTALGPLQPEEGGMDDALIHESIEESVAEENELWQRETGRDPEAAGVRPSEVVGRYER